MPTFQLFRIKLIDPRQLTLPLTVSRRKPDVLRAAIESRPTAEFREGQTWRIGNVESCDEHAIYFAFGRTTKSSLELFDAASQNFRATAVDNSPNTHVFVDFRLQVCAIAKRSSLAQSVAHIGRQLAQVLTGADAVRGSESQVEIEPIPDPEDFVSQLTGAYQISSFSMHFSRPNPIDVEQDLQLPLERTLSAIGGEAGKTTFRGPALDGEELAKLARAAAATGSDASARLRTAKSAKPVTKHLFGSAVTMSQDEEDAADLAKMKPSVIGWMREQYARVRGTISSPP